MSNDRLSSKGKRRTLLIAGIISVVLICSVAGCVAVLIGGELYAEQVLATPAGSESIDAPEATLVPVTDTPVPTATPTPAPTATPS